MDGRPNGRKARRPDVWITRSPDGRNTGWPEDHMIRSLDDQKSGKWCSQCYTGNSLNVLPAQSSLEQITFHLVFLGYFNYIYLIG